MCWFNLILCSAFVLIPEILYHLNLQSIIGCPADMVRLSIGIESIGDILGDLDQALATATK